MVLSAKRSVTNERQHKMVLEPGLYLLRYVSSNATSSPPLIQIAPSNAVSLLAGSGPPFDRLDLPGSYALVQSDTSASLELTARARDAGGSVDAEVRLERIAPHQVPDQAPRERSVPKSRSVGQKPDGETLQIIAHVSHRGDVQANVDEWICGPELPLPIEGIELRWPNTPPGVSLSYVAKAARTIPASCRESSLGGFVGTRGKKTPLVGLSLTLDGPASFQAEIEIDALFLGTQVLTKRGRHVEVTGPTGREPLVGLRMRLVARDAHIASPRNSRPAKSIESTRVGKIRVYRPAQMPEIPVRF
jgi:hypothetical protein